MAKYNVIESVNMKSTNYAERIFDVVLDKDIENGTFGYLKGLAEGESHIYNFAVGPAQTGERIVVIDQPVWSPDPLIQRNLKESDMINEKGSIVRARVIGDTDEMGFNEKVFSKAEEAKDIKAGDIFVINVDGKLLKSNDMPSGDVRKTVFVFNRIRKSTVSALYSDITKISGNDDIYEFAAREFYIAE